MNLQNLIIFVLYDGYSKKKKLTLVSSSSAIGNIY
jgi:hypothetical protein